MHEVIGFHVEIPVNHKRSILYVRPSIKNLLAVFLAIQESWPFGCFRILGRFFQVFFTCVIGGRVRPRCTLGNFQCRGVLLFCIIVGRTVLAKGAGGGLSKIISHYFSLSISTEVLSQRAI